MKYLRSFSGCAKVRYVKSVDVSEKVGRLTRKPFMAEGWDVCVMTEPPPLTLPSLRR